MPLNQILNWFQWNIENELLSFHFQHLVLCNIIHDESFKVSIEAGITQGWEKYTGNCKLSTLNIGINRFGESAPGKEVADYFGLNVEVIKEKIIKAFKI